MVYTVQEREISRIRAGFNYNNIDKKFQDLVLEVIYSDEWNWWEDMDGCTKVNDLSPTRYAEPCLVHDWFWRTGRGGIVSDKIFRKLMIQYRELPIC